MQAVVQGSAFNLGYFCNSHLEKVRGMFEWCVSSNWLFAK